MDLLIDELIDALSRLIDGMIDALIDTLSRLIDGEMIDRWID